ncbi:CGNR zinc finger domain-containing protein [Nocardia rhamnosiphila]
MTSGASPGLTLHSRTGVDYHFDPGALCLELLPTGGPGPYRVYEILHTPADLVTWVGRSRLTPTPELTITTAEVAAARHLRDTLFETTRARSHGEPSTSHDLDVLNDFATAAPLIPRITAAGARAWAPDTGTALLSTVARDAIDLLSGPHAGRIRTCSAADCQLIYVDTSRPGRRRWCSMEHCGNRNKVRAHRARTPEKEG